MRPRTLTLLRVLAGAVVAAAVVPSIVVSGCGGSKGSAGVDAGSPNALAHANGEGAKGDAGASIANDAGADADTAAAEESPPTVDAADMTLRGRHLLEAIAHGEPKLASDIVYPRDAYIATKDHADPGKQWDKKTYPAFERDVNTLRKRLRVSEQAQFVSFEIGPSVVQAPAKKRDLKRTVWRVRHSKLTFAAAGKTQRIEIAEMTAWRGSWYISKLR